jgi:hypothetical protein
MCGENPPDILIPVHNRFGGFTVPSVTSHLREYIYLTCYACILQHHISFNFFSILSICYSVSVYVLPLLLVCLLLSRVRYEPGCMCCSFSLPVTRSPSTLNTRNTMSV